MVLFLSLMMFMVVKIGMSFATYFLDFKAEKEERNRI
jgi:hypothetical protein